MRRVAWVLVVYLLVAWLVTGLAGWLQRVLALPPLFRELGLALLVLGLVVAIAVAWRYPELGHVERAADSGTVEGRADRDA